MSKRTILVASPSVAFKTKTVTIMKKYIFILNGAITYDSNSDNVTFNYQVGQIPDTDGTLKNINISETVASVVKMTDIQHLITLPPGTEELTISERLKQISELSFKAMAEKTEIYQFQQFDFMEDEETNLPNGVNPVNLPTQVPEM